LLQRVKFSWRPLADSFSATSFNPRAKRFPADDLSLADCAMNRTSPSQFPPVSRPGSGEEPTQHRSEPSHDALPPGTQLAEYELQSVLGEGRFGIVYLAMDHGLQRQVAIKEYLPAALASRGIGTAVALRSDGHAETFALGLESFIDEARLLARFDHPALVRVHRFWEANGTAYVVMPYYAGVTVGVARAAMEHPPDEAWLRDLLLPLLGALDVLHGAACYPRDISPENILLLPDGRPVLLGLGAARHVIGDRTQALTAILEPAFAPIEQYAESTKLRQGPWTNLYALAAVAYYCVSGRSPVASTVRALDDQMEPLSQVVDRLGRSFPELDYGVAFVSAIERALSVRPQERPQSVAAFRRALLGGRGAAEAVVMPPAVTEAESNVASPPFPSSREETGPFQVFPNAPDGGNVEDASRGALRAMAARSEAEGRAEAASGKSGRRRRNFPIEGQRSWGRTLLMGGAAVALVVLGAGGWMIWSDYRDAKVELRSMALSTEPDGRRAPLLPPEPPAEFPAPVPGAAAGPRLPPPGSAAPEAAPGEPPPGEKATVAEAPAEESPREFPARAVEAPNPLPLAKGVKKESDNPRVLCAPRTRFSLYRCMQVECERPKYYDHPECKYLRVMDEVRALP
jgi:serine/threonine protein kinase